ncbi:MAG: DNA polymerase IV, partial [Hyphomicrobiales bacterium]|nr:DNA polymerase IV [Hyphomicrobiales bacterium]
ETKSISAETTFPQDLSRLDELEPILLRLCERVALRLRRAGLCGATITLKLKTARFASRTRALSQPDPTALSTRLFAVGRDLLKAEIDGTPFRLIGIGVSGLQKLEAADPQTLLNPDLAREKATEQAIMDLRARFGDAAVSRGLAFHPKKT